MIVRFVQPLTVLKGQSVEMHLSIPEPGGNAVSVGIRTIGNYTNTYNDEGDLMTVKEFMSAYFRDCDGHGLAYKDGKLDVTNKVIPSLAECIPHDATHVVWFNK